MVDRYWIGFFIVHSCFVQVLNASAGDAGPLYRECITQCERSGCVGKKCFPDCKFSSDDVSIDGPWYIKESLYSQWKHQNCQSDCRYNCMLDREKEREESGLNPMKYHGKWPFKRVYGIEEPLSVAFSALNLVVHFRGWLSFFGLIYHRLPLKQNKKAYYEYDSLWHINGLLAMNSSFWSCVFHSRGIDFIENLRYSAQVALTSYSLLVAILRSFSVKTEATRVAIAAPLLAFTTTHIMYINFVELDYGWNLIVCGVMAVAQLLIWAIWGGVTRHPSRRKLWVVVLGSGLATLLQVYDFPPYKEFIDAHALWHATTIPLTYIWWSFIRDDAEFRTSNILKKAK